MKCCVCGKEIQRGKKFKSPTLVSKNFCSEHCYNEYLQTTLKKKEEPFPGYNNLKDYVNEQWQGSENINWPQFYKTVTNLIDTFEINCDNMYGCLKYAIEYENKTVDLNYGIGQFIPKYLTKYYNFKESILKNEKIASDENLDEEIILIKPHKQKSFYKLK